MVAATAIIKESIANPGGVVTDIAAVAEIAKRANVPLIVDNTLATPFLCRPFDHFFFQAEDCIRDFLVTGVQTCALPISARRAPPSTPASRSWLTPVVASSGSSAATASAVRPRPSPSQHGSAIVSDRPAEGQPFYYGGQAVLEGVMMRGRDNWAVAVRRPQGQI